MSDYNMTNSEALHHQLERELGGFNADVHVEALSNDEAKAITDANIINEDEEDEDTDPIVTAMSNAVNTPMIGSMPIGNALNNAELDEAMTEWMNRGI